MTYSIIISTEDVYGLTDPKIPAGYAKTGEFRPALVGEFFLSSTDTNAMRASHNLSTRGPRIILRKLDDKELFIQEALSLLKSLYPVKQEGDSLMAWELINKGEELIDV